MAISIALRCEPCIKAYVNMASEQGITQEELVEFLEVAMTMQGCPGEEWALKAWTAYKECAGGQSDNRTCQLLCSSRRFQSEGGQRAS